MNGKKAKQRRREMRNQQKIVQNMQVRPEDLKMLSCSNPECDSKLFTQIFEIGMISGLINPTGKDQFIQIPKMVCIKCGALPNIKKKEVAEEKEESKIITQG